MKPEITLTRGLPASGKSTWAVQTLLTHPNKENIIRVERDLLRDQLFGTRLNLESSQENLITSVQMSMAKAAVNAGKHVIVSDTNLRAQYVRQWAKFATDNGANFEQVIFDNVSLDELIKRDANRINSVGAEVITSLWKKFTKNGKISKVDVSKEMSHRLVIDPYVNDSNLPSAIIVDIDGTLATMNDRSPYDWMRVGEDSPVEAVIDAVDSAYKSGKTIIFMSGRDSSCRDITIKWLQTHLKPFNDERFALLYMRAEGDNRKDDLVKYELFNNHVRNKYHVKYVLDDRDQVVKMWRSLGLNCFQVNYGNF